MITKPSYIAKQQLAELLRLAEVGFSVAITRHGQPIAKLAPLEDHEKLQLEEQLKETKR